MRHLSSGHGLFPQNGIETLRIDCKELKIIAPSTGCELWYSYGVPHDSHLHDIKSKTRLKPHLYNCLHALYHTDASAQNLADQHPTIC